MSRSFLYPTRKQLFAYISLAQCQRILDLLIRHPYMQSFVKSLTIIYRPDLYIEDVLIAVYRLLLGSLPIFVFDVSLPGHLACAYDWRKLSRNLRDTLSDTIHSPSLTSLSLMDTSHVPIGLFLGLKGVRTLTCYGVDFSDGNTRGVSQTADFDQVWSSAADRAPIEDFTWTMQEGLLLHPIVVSRLISCDYV